MNDKDCICAEMKVAIWADTYLGDKCPVFHCPEHGRVVVSKRPELEGVQRLEAATSSK